MQMTYEAFLDSIHHRGGFASTDVAEAYARATLRVLGGALADSDREALGVELPEALSQPLCSPPPGQAVDIDQFYRRIGQARNVDPQRAMEAAQVVGEVLGRAVPPRVVNRLIDRLPDDYRQVFVNPHQGGDGRDDRLDPTATANDRTLAGGEAGSQIPLSESAPAEGHPGSVAAGKNPREDAKLASGRESTDKDDQTLAGGKSGSDRPISDTHQE